MSDLYAMLGVAPTIRLPELRWKYEVAVREAVHRGVWSRANELSAAFDALPRHVRMAVYPGREWQVDRWSRPATITGQQRPSARPSVVGPSRSARRASRKARARAKAASTGMRLPFRIAACVLAVVTAFCGAVAVVQHSGGTPASSERGVGVPAVAVVPARPPGYRVPAHAHTMRAGLAEVVCEPQPGAPGYVQWVAPGADVWCANGAIPQLVGRRGMRALHIATPDQAVAPQPAR